MNIINFIDSVAKTHCPSWGQNDYLLFVIGTCVFLGFKLAIDIICLFHEDGRYAMVPVIVYNLIVYPLVLLGLLWIHPGVYCGVGIVWLIVDFIFGCRNVDGKNNTGAPLGLVQYSLWRYSLGIWERVRLRDRYLANYTENLKTNTL